MSGLRSSGVRGVSGQRLVPRRLGSVLKGHASERTLSLCVDGRKLRNEEDSNPHEGV